MVEGWKQNGSFPTSYLDFINDSLTKTFGANLANKKIMEFGQGDPTFDSKVFESKKMIHTYIEPSGTDGSTVWPISNVPAPNAVFKVLHLSDQLTEYNNYFDAIVNISTTEHLEPYENQYDIWKNIHSMCKVDGVMIHILPDSDECRNYLRWYGHCHYYFGYDFFEYLANVLDYEIINNELLNFNRSIALKKTSNSNFNFDRAEFLSKIAVF
ncbi:MAG: hypothetical protein EBT86_05975 [Actinobacteria bacterium]|nr:hypothetical protein [Actinomycetota bacterium]